MARDDVKAELARLVFRGRTEDEIRSRADRYGKALLASRLRSFMVDRVTAHVDAGHDTLFVSASLTYYIEPIADALGMDAVIAVELESIDGVFTGELARPNVRAHEKVVRLDEWTAATGGGDRELWSYGNSSGDHALLAAADHAFWLGRPTKAPAHVGAHLGPGRTASTRTSLRRLPSRRLPSRHLPSRHSPDVDAVVSGTSRRPIRSGSRAVRVTDSAHG